TEGAHLLEYPDQRQPLARRLTLVLQQQTLELVAPRINPRPRLPAALIAKLGRLRPDHLAHHPSRHPKLAANGFLILSQFEEAVWHRRGSDCDIAEAWHHGGEIVSAVEAVLEFGEVAGYMLVADGAVS